MSSSRTLSRECSSAEMVSNSERDSRTSRTNWWMLVDVLTIELLTARQPVVTDLTEEVICETGGYNRQ